MKTVLIGWELGAGRGHVERLAPMVTKYLEQGWRVIAVLRDMPLALERFASLRAAYGPARLEVLQAPRFADRPFPDVPLFSLAQIYCYMGFDDPAMVAPLVAEWERLLAHYRPQLVLSDASPNLNLAARGSFRLTVIGNGWTIPPDCDLTPSLRPVPDGVLLQDFEARVVDCARGVVGSDRAPRRFCDLLRGEHNLVFTIPELDPYRAVRSDRYVWPPELPSPAPVDPVQRSGGLIYLPFDHPAHQNVIEACSKSSIPFIGYFGGEGVGQYGNLRVVAKPIDFVREVPRSKLVIHHGGLGTAIWCMANQVPQVIYARDLEKKLIAQAVMKNASRHWIRCHRVSEITPGERQ